MQTTYKLVETHLQEQLESGAVRCHLCQWRCKLVHGQRGFCQAHVNRNGTLYNLSFGIISAIDVGPIEDKPVRHFRPGSQVMSVGSYGCNFRCGGCHNLDISWGVEALDLLAKGQSSAAYASPSELVESALRLSVDGIAFTYSEPAVWLEYVIEVSRLAREAGLFTVYVSNSFVTRDALEVMAPWIDVLCSDIKSFDDDFYKDICSVASVNQVLDTIDQAHHLGIHVETRTNIIPGKNNNPETYRAIASWIKDHLGENSPWHITRFFPAFKLAHLPTTPLEDMLRAVEIARDVGLNNVYVYGDKGCDCAEENLPITSYLSLDESDITKIKKCSADCCGEDGILLKKYEKSV